MIAFILIFVGVLSSVASDAGYLILIPLGAAAFLTLGRHPLAGMAAAFAGVGAIFGVNLLITPIDSMLTEITNEAIPSGTEPLTVTANYFFSVASSVVLAIVAMFVTQRIVEKRLGPYDAAHGAADATTEELDGEALAAEARGLRFAFYGLLGSLAVIALLTFPSGAPLRDPVTGSIVGTTPVHGQPAFPHHADLPRVRHLLRDGGEVDVGQWGCHRRCHQDLCRVGRVWSSCS